MKYPKFILHNFNTQNAYLIMHGGSKGIESEFLQKLIDKSASSNTTTLAFNFPYLDRGEESSSGPELIEELETMHTMVQMLADLGVKNITIIAKSLGGIVASYYLNSKLRSNNISFSLIIMGFVIPDVRLPLEVDKLIVIQGAEDKFGNIQKVREFLSEPHPNSSLISVEGADHSYRDPEKNPIYEDEAIDAAFKAL
jgi:predicted alpha/beta-hydrolase family hydrolase